MGEDTNKGKVVMVSVTVAVPSVSVVSVASLSFERNLHGAYEVFVVEKDVVTEV